MKLASMPIALALLLALASARADEAATRGPAKGTLIAIGGGAPTLGMYRRFVEAAGGRGASVVFVPTAMEGDLSGREWPTVRRLERGGLEVTVLHTRDRREADSKAFVAPLERATGVWLSGGRQWRFTDAYLGTRALEAMRGVLERGGVVAGSSAGATVQASYMVRGKPGDNRVMMAEGHEEGFGFLRGAAIDQHLVARGRERDLIPVVEKHPELLGIGIDESTAIVVTGDRFEVIGLGRVAIYDRARWPEGATPAPAWLDRGAVFDLAARRRVIRVATDAVFPPFHYVDDDGALAGYDVEVARAVVKRMGCLLELRRAPSYEALFRDLETGRHDLVAATTGITRERRASYALSHPYFETYQSIVVLASSAVTAPGDLRGRPVGAAAGTTSALATTAIGATLVPRVKGADPLAALRAGDVAAIIADEFEARQLAEAHDDLRMLDAPAAREHYALVMRRDDTSLAERVDRALSTLRADGTMASLRRRFEVERPVTADDPAR